MSERFHQPVMGVGVPFLPDITGLETGVFVQRTVPGRIRVLQLGHDLPGDPADLDEQVGGQFFPDDGLDIPAVVEVSGQFRPAREDRRHAE